MTCPRFTHVLKDGRSFSYECPSITTLWRARTLFSKEPDTIRWIDSFEDGEILYDVGANVGMYSIYAGVRNVKVFAFEPEAQNFALLNRNIAINGLQDSVVGFNLALSPMQQLNYLFVSSELIGGACNNFGESLDHNGKPVVAKYRQGAFSVPVDDLWERFGLPLPNYVKIDVDGLEPEIIKSALATLRSPLLKSILVELNEQLPEHMQAVEIIKSNGFSLATKYHAPEFDQGRFSRCYNYIFTRTCPEGEQNESQGSCSLN
jgi:FkbM family methyltransferase